MTLLSFLARLLAFAAIASFADAASIRSSLQGRASAVVQAAGSRKVIDQSDGASYMRAAQMTDTIIVGVYESIEGDNQVLRVVGSVDSGDSWSRIGVVDSVNKDEYSIGNPHIIQLPDGRLLCAHRNHRFNKDTSTGFSNFAMTLHQSDDGGETWQKISDIYNRQRDGVNGVWEPFLRLSPNSNRLQVFWSSENSADDQDIVLQESPDLGQTWSDPVIVAGQDRRTRDGMPSVANVADSSGNSQAYTIFESALGALYEGARQPTFVVDYVKGLDNSDESKWGDRARIYTPKDNLQAGAPWVINVGGTLVVSFMTNENFPDLPTVDAGELKIVTSKDFGKSWSPPIIVGKKGSHWPGLIGLNSKEFLVLWSEDGSGLLSQRFST